MLEHVVKLAVIYNCKIAISGYEIIDGDRSSNVIRTPSLLYGPLDETGLV